MLVAGSDTDKSAYYFPDKFKVLLRQETQKDYEAKVLLSDGNSHFTRSQSRHSIHKVSNRSRRFLGQFQGQTLRTQKSPTHNFENRNRSTQLGKN